ncbi:MAG: haloacid dehalogenase-like hydrolase [Puniceicoccales bacterium]|jgi:putative flippase GtrA/phosphoserine phosphatase|nr:haloacid dehalogenase-like hydrolase [Puniceicoccales bacterium]
MNIYDFDDTIYAGDSSVKFFLFALRRHPRLALGLPAQFWAILRYNLGLGTREEMKERYFAFIKKIPLDAEIAAFWNENRAKIKSWYLAQKRPDDLIVSASPEFLLADIVQKHLGVHLIASKLSPVTLKYDGLNCRGDEKVRRIREVFHNLYPDKDLPDAKNAANVPGAPAPENPVEACYSDSLSDAPLVNLAPPHGRYMVRGDRRLLWHDYRPSLLSRLKSTFLTPKFILFVFCGGTGTAVNILCSTLFLLLLGGNATRGQVSTGGEFSFTLAQTAYAFGYAASIFATYTLNAKLVFHAKLALLDFLKFVASYIPNFLILFAFVSLLLNTAGWPPVLVYTLAAFVAIPITYLLVKLLVFGGIDKRAATTGAGGRAMRK